MVERESVAVLDGEDVRDYPRHQPRRESETAVVTARDQWSIPQPTRDACIDGPIEVCFAFVGRVSARVVGSGGASVWWCRCVW